MDIQFEVFNKKSSSRSKAPTITIQRRGTISLNGAAAKMLYEEPKNIPVDLLFSKEKRIVGIRRSSGNPNPYVIRRQGDTDTYMIPGRAFTAHLKLNTDVARRYNVVDYGGGIIGFCLDDPFSEIVRGPRRSRKPSPEDKPL